MSTVEQDETVEPRERAGSLEDRIEARSRELEQEPEHGIVIPLPGFPFLAVQYRALEYEEGFNIELRHEKVKDRSEQVLRIAADKLINACEAIVEQTAPDTYSDTGYRWNKNVRQLFARRCASLAPDARARDILIAVFPDREAVVEHAAEYEEQRKAIRTEIDKRLAGESEGD